ncbi:hypothetical protein ACIPSA_22980 [Streptomyces sp. NPDC086549]|uniref:hypothetical protein n=1 Tax=Streptomyces sp. NPDC086549 TaxID=3365752 RepID=UPI003801A24C
MAHAAPASRAVTRRVGPPDVFSERAHAIARWAWPVTLGLVYGYWAAANVRYGGPITGWNLLFGFVTAIVFAAVYMGIQALAPRLPREVHAVLWGAFTAIAVGFLYSLSGHGHTVLESTILGVVIGAAVFCTLFYRYYTHEDAEGHRIR